MNALELLTRRIEVLEKCYVGVPNSYFTGEQYDITSKLDEISAKISIVEQEVPALKTCHDLIKKMQPLVFSKRANLTEILQRIDTISSGRHLLNDNIADLKAISELSPAINSYNFTEVEVLQGRLDSLEIELQCLKEESKTQTNEIDELLEIYEHAVSIISEVCFAWESNS